MPDLDAMARYAELRKESGLGPHNSESRVDQERLDFFLAGVVAGTQNVLLKIKEKSTETHCRH